MVMAATSPYHVFISHAVEDKIAIANDLNQGLRQKGLHTWYSGQELSVGDPITATIRQGLKGSCCGIIIISPHFFPSRWQKEEMAALLAGGKKIFLVLHDVNLETLEAYDPLLADLYALSSERDLNEVIDLLSRKIREVVISTKEKKKLQKEWINWLIYSFSIALALTILLLGWLEWKKETAFEQKVSEAVRERVGKIEELIENRKVAVYSQAEACKVSEMENACVALEKFQGTRFGFSFEDAIHERVDHKVHVKNRLGIQIEKNLLCQSFGLEGSECVSIADCNSEESMLHWYFFLNKDPLDYQLSQVMKVSESQQAAVVNYRHFIRSVSIRQEYIDRLGRGYTHTAVIGLPPEEVYLFRKEGEEWELETIDLQLGR